MKTFQSLLLISALLTLLFCGCRNAEEASAVLERSVTEASAANVTMAEGTELETYSIVTVLSGEDVQWLDTQNGLTAYTSQAALTLDETYAVIQETPLVLPVDESVKGYCVSGTDTCLLTETGALIYRGDTLLFQQDGTWVAAAAASSGFYLLRLDAGSEEASGSWMLCRFDGSGLTEVAQIPEMGEFGTICSGQDGTIYIGTSEGIASFDPNTDSCTYVLKWTDCGIYGYDVTAIGKTEGGFLAVVAGDLCLLTPGQAEEINEPVTLHLGTLTSGYSVTSQLASNFNRSQTDYRLEIAEFSDLASLNMAIVSGELDLLHIYDLPQSSYIAKGVLENLDPWIAQDDTISASDFFPTVWNATDTGRYSLIASFTLKGLMAPESLVGDRTGWTFSEFQSVIADSNVLQKNTKQLMLAITFDAGQYINLETNTASFDSEAFLGYLGYLNQFLLNDSEMLADGTASQLTNADILSVYGTEQETYSSIFWNGSPVRFLGFPSEDAGGMSIDTVSGLELGMVSTGNQAGAWAVIAYALSDDFLSTASNIGLPARIDTLNAQIAEAIEKSQNGGQIYSADCGETLLSLIENASQKRIWDSQIESIVQEEVTAFFTGDKSAEETAKIIQNRVSIYLAEQS